MVRLSRIYTGVGDQGLTRLGDGSQVPKHSPRIEACGAVDEANAALGVAVAMLATGGGQEPAPSIGKALGRIQNDLFDLGADLSTPGPGKSGQERLRILPQQTAWLESQIETYNARLAPLESFVLPGGSLPAAQLHVARTVVRRAERRVAALLAAEPEATNAQVLVYLNRLSDLLFVWSRVLNDEGQGDVKWVPGAGRGAGDRPEDG